MSRPDVLVIGLGNRLRGDDGVGTVVAGAIRERGIAGIDAMTCDGDGTALLECWRGVDSVIVVDALRSKEAPGRIRRFEASRPLPAWARARSTHGFGLAEAVEMARSLDRLPSALVIYGVVGESWGMGEGLSPAVSAAVPRVVDLVLAEARAAAPARPGAGT